jgi:hypothetical protein
LLNNFLDKCKKQMSLCFLSFFWKCFIQNSILNLLSLVGWFLFKWWSRFWSAAAHHHLHHCSHHVLRFASPCSSLGVFVGAILSGASQTKFAFDLRMQINAFFTVCACWEIFAVFSRMDKGAFFAFLAIWKMPASHGLFGGGWGRSFLLLINYFLLTGCLESLHSALFLGGRR